MILFELEVDQEESGDEVLAYLEDIYRNHAPEFNYYKTLFHILEKFLRRLLKYPRMSRVSYLGQISVEGRRSIP